jgi:hypothetical protein
VFLVSLIQKHLDFFLLIYSKVEDLFSLEECTTYGMGGGNWQLATGNRP